jgi:tetratricopeptide (TPR) repeat protein
MPTRSDSSSPEQFQAIQTQRSLIAWWEDGWKWARRHPGIAMSIGVSGVASCLALAAVTLHVMQVDKLNEGLENEIRATRTQSRRANENLRGAVAVVERMIRLGRSELANVPHLEQVRRQILEDALVFFKEFVVGNAEQPGMRELVAFVRVEIGNIHRQLGNLPAAERDYRQSLLDLAALAQGATNPHRIREETASCQASLGLIFLNTARPDEANASFHEALKSYRSLQHDYPEVLQFSAQEAQIHNNLGLLALGREWFDVADSEFADALLLLDELPVIATESDEFALQRCEVLINLASLYQRQGKLAEARAVYERQIESMRDVMEESRGLRDLRWNLSTAYNNVATVSRALGEFDRAEQAFREALRLSDELSSNFPTVAIYRRSRAHVLDNLGMLLAQQGREAEAETIFRSSIAVRQRLVGKETSLPSDDFELAAGWNLLATLLLGRNQLDEARQLAEKSLQLFESRPGNASEDLKRRVQIATTEHLLADILEARHEETNAETHLRQAVEQQRAVLKEAPANAEYRRLLAYHLQGLIAHLRKTMRLEDVPELERELGQLE